MCRNAQEKTDGFESVVLEGKVLVDSIKSVSLIERKSDCIFSPFILSSR